VDNPDLPDHNSPGGARPPKSEDLFALLWKLLAHFLQLNDASCDFGKKGVKDHA
jgi:hypothetical protein